MKRQKDFESKDPSKVVGAIRQAFRETQNGIGKAVGTERKRLIDRSIDRNSEETLLLLAEHASGRVQRIRACSAHPGVFSTAGMNRVISRDGITSGSLIPKPFSFVLLQTVCLTLNRLLLSYYIIARQKHWKKCSRFDCGLPLFQPCHCVLEQLQSIQSIDFVSRTCGYLTEMTLSLSSTSSKWRSGTVDGGGQSASVSATSSLYIATLVTKEVP